MQDKPQTDPIDEPHHQPAVVPEEDNFHVYFMRGNQHRNLTKKQQIEVAEIVRLDPMSKSYYLFNTYEAERKIRRWKELLPWITPHYAIKCNPYLELATIYFDHGAGVDCASKFQVEKAFELKVHPDRIIYSNPKKDENDLKWAGENGILLTTADTIPELHKIKKYAPNMRILWRVTVQAPEGGNLVTNFGNKFGDDISTDEQITDRMKEIAELGFNLKGTHFHCGCGHEGSKGHHKGIELSRRIITIGRTYGHEMSIMDLGGGWTAGEMTQEKADSLQLSHGDVIDYKVVAEPGRHFAQNMFHLLVRVIAKHVKKTQIGYYVNDSMYMNLIGTKIDDIDLSPKSQIYSSISGKDLTISDKLETEVAVIFGMTCDGIDIICKDVSIPKDLKIGDWFCIGGMGAYSYGVATNFNGMRQDKFVHWEAKMQ